MRTISKEWLAFLREQFPRGSQVICWELDDPEHISIGTLEQIDEEGRFHTRLEDGTIRKLALGEEQFSVQPPEPTLLKLYMPLTADFYGRDWTEDHRISTGCLWNGAIDRYLEGHPQVKRLVFAVDNDYLARDKDGQFRNWGQLTAAKWVREYTGRGFQCAIHVPHLNDFNTDLVERRKGRTVEDLDRLRMAELEAEFNKGAVEEPENEDEQEMEA